MNPSAIAGWVALGERFVALAERVVALAERQAVQEAQQAAARGQAAGKAAAASSAATEALHAAAGYVSSGDAQCKTCAASRPHPTDAALRLCTNRAATFSRLGDCHSRIPLNSGTRPPSY